ncbi:MAG: hypothetical protein WCY92_11150 [Novosphingobium sp.]
MRIAQRLAGEGRAGGNVATGAISGPLGLILDRWVAWRGWRIEALLRASLATSAGM